jgi:hypothetical protein
MHPGCGGNMVRIRWFLVLFVLLFSGCIEAGSLSLSNDDRRIDLTSLGSQLKDVQRSPYSSEMGVPLKSLPRHFVRSREEGSYREVLTLEGLPSTTILWRVEKDPFAKDFEMIKTDSSSRIDLEVGSTEIKAEVTDTDDLYRITTHIGIYTFIAETNNPGDIDSVNVFGTHEEVVNKVFTAGLENALTYDLDSLGY